MSTEDDALTTTVRVVYTVEYDVIEGAVPDPGNEEAAELFVRALLDAAPGRSVDVDWDDDGDPVAVLEPKGWGVQTDYWGDIWTGMKADPCSR